jgi:proteasome accessory factor C
LGSTDRLNCANFGASEYLVYAELSDGTISVQREQHSDVFARPARLSPVEARACLRALDFVGRQVIGSSDALRTAREKILSAAGLPDAPDTAVVAPFGGEATGDLAETINRGLRDGRALRLTYTPADAAQAKRYTVDPFELFNAHEAWYLAGWSRESDGERHFRLDRVAEVEVLDEPVADRPRAGDPLAWVTGGEFGGETSTGVLAFDAELARWIAEEPFPNRPRTDGGLLVWRRYASDAWLAREVCKYGGRCELLAPEGARAAVADLARRTLSAYRQPAVA